MGVKVNTDVKTSNDSNSEGYVFEIDAIEKRMNNTDGHEKEKQFREVIFSKEKYEIKNHFYRKYIHYLETVCKYEELIWIYDYNANRVKPFHNSELNNSYRLAKSIINADSKKFAKHAKNTDLITEPDDFFKQRYNYFIKAFRNYRIIKKDKDYNEVNEIIQNINNSNKGEFEDNFKKIKGKLFDIIMIGDFHGLYEEVRKLIVKYGRNSNLIEEYNYIKNNILINTNSSLKTDIEYLKAESINNVLKDYVKAENIIVEYINENMNISMNFFDLLGRVYNNLESHEKTDLLLEEIRHWDIENSIGHLVFLKRVNSRDKLKTVYISVLERFDNNILNKYRRTLEEILEFIVKRCIDSEFTKKLYQINNKTNFLAEVLLKYSLYIENIYYILKYHDDEKIEDQVLIDAKNKFIEKKLSEFINQIEMGEIEFLEDFIYDREIFCENKISEDYINNKVEDEFLKSLDDNKGVDKYNEILKFLIKYPKNLLIWHQLQKYTPKFYFRKKSKKYYEVENFFIRIQDELYDEFFLELIENESINRYHNSSLYKKYVRFLIYKGNDNVIDDFYIKRMIHLSKVISFGLFDIFFKKGKENILNNYNTSLKRALYDKNVYRLKNEEFVFNNINELEKFINLIETDGIKGSDILTNRFENQSKNIIDNINKFLSKVDIIKGKFPDDEYDLQKYVLGKIKYKKKKRIKEYLDKYYHKKEGEAFYDFVSFYNEHWDIYNSKIVANFMDLLLFSNNDQKIIRGFKKFSNYLLHTISIEESSQFFKKIYACDREDPMISVLFYPNTYYIGLDNYIKKIKVLKSYDHLFNNLSNIGEKKDICPETKLDLIRFIRFTFKRILYIVPRFSINKSIIKGIVNEFKENEEQIQEVGQKFTDSRMKGEFFHAFNDLVYFANNVDKFIEDINEFELSLDNRHFDYFDYLIKSNINLEVELIKDVEDLIKNEFFCEYLMLISRKTYFETALLIGTEKLKCGDNTLVIGNLIYNEDNMKGFNELVKNIDVLDYHQSILHHPIKFIKVFRSLLRSVENKKNVRLHFTYAVTRFGMELLKDNYIEIFKGIDNNNTEYLRQLFVQYDKKHVKELYLLSGNSYFYNNRYKEAYKNYINHFKENEIIYDDLIQAFRNNYLISKFAQTKELETFNIRPKYLKSVVRRLQSVGSLSEIRKSFYEEVIESKSYALCLIWDILYIANKDNPNFSFAKFLVKRLLDVDQNNIKLEAYYSKKVDSYMEKFNNKNVETKVNRQVTSIDDFTVEDKLCLEKDVTRYSRSIILKDNYYMNEIKPKQKIHSLSSNFCKYEKLSDFLYEQYSWQNITMDKTEIDQMINKTKAGKGTQDYRTNYGKLAHLYSILIFNDDDINTILDKLYNMIINLTKSEFFYDEKYRVDLIYYDTISILMEYDYFSQNTEDLVNILRHYWFILENQDSVKDLIGAVNNFKQITEKYYYVDNYSQEIYRIQSLFSKYNRLVEYEALEKYEKVRFLRNLIIEGVIIRPNDSEHIAEAKDSIRYSLNNKLFNLQKNLAEYDIFISHTTKDYDRAEPLVKALENKNLKVWIDFRCLKYGDYGGEIHTALKKSHYVMYLVSDKMIKNMLLKSSYIFVKEFRPIDNLLLEHAIKPIVVSLTGDVVNTSYLDKLIKRIESNPDQIENRDVFEERCVEVREFISSIESYNQKILENDYEKLASELYENIK